MKNRPSKNRKYIIDILIVVTILVMAAIIYYRVDQMIDDRKISGDEIEAASRNTPDAAFSPELAEQTSTQSSAAPALAFNLNNLDGEDVALSDHLGKAVMVNFWATWCPPCRNEMPIIQNFAAAHPDQLVVLAINAGEESPAVENFVNSHNLDAINFLMDPSNSVSDLYRVPGLPTSLFIDAEGLLQGVHIGELNEAYLAEYLAGIGVK
ncbi:MAG: TlpA disulfide reductase family protein [Brevefilum sp.]|nr:TlpA disulfide reductase family protein [Brevefilum sp.]